MTAGEPPQILLLSCRTSDGVAIEFKFGDPAITRFTASPWWQNRGPWPTDRPDLTVKAGVVTAAGRSIESNRDALIKEPQALTRLWGPPADWRPDTPVPGTPAATRLPELGSAPAAAGAYCRVTCLGDLMTPPRGVFKDKHATLPGVGDIRLHGVVFEREARDLRTIASMELGGVDDPNRVQLARAFALTHLSVLPLLHEARMIAGDVRLQNTLLPQSEADWRNRWGPPRVRLTDFSHASFLDPENATGAAARPTVATRYLTPPTRLDEPRGPRNDWYAFAVSLYELLFDGELPFVFADDPGRPITVEGQILSDTARAGADCRRVVKSGVDLSTRMRDGLVVRRRRDHQGAPELNLLLDLLLTDRPAELDAGVRRLLELSPQHFVAQILTATELDAKTLGVNLSTNAEEEETERSAAAQHTQPNRRLVRRPRRLADKGLTVPNQPSQPKPGGDRLRARANAHTREIAERARNTAAAPASVETSTDPIRRTRGSTSATTGRTSSEGHSVIPILTVLVAPLVAAVLATGLTVHLVNTHHVSTILHRDAFVALSLAWALFIVLGGVVVARHFTLIHGVSNIVCGALFPPVLGFSRLGAEAAYHKLYPRAAWLARDWNSTQRFIEIAFIIGAAITLTAVSGTGRAAARAFAGWLGVIRLHWIPVALAVIATVVAIAVPGVAFATSVANMPVFGSDRLSCTSPLTFAIPTDRVCVSGTAYWTQAAPLTAAAFTGVNHPLTNTLTLTDRSQPCLSARLNYHSFGRPISKAQLATPQPLGVTPAARTAVIDWLRWQPQLVAGHLWRYHLNSRTDDGRITSATRYWTSTADAATQPADTTSTAGSASSPPTGSTAATTTVTVDVMEKACSTRRGDEVQRTSAIRALLAGVQLRESNCLDAATFQSLNGGTPLAVVRAASAVCVPVTLGLQPSTPPERYTDMAFLRTGSKENWFLYIFSASSSEKCDGKPTANGYTLVEQDQVAYYCRIFRLGDQAAKIYLSDGYGTGKNPGLDALIGRARAEIAVRKS